MASSSGTSLTSSFVVQNSGSECDLQNMMDPRKRKRMISNRESARRSRMRKQNHMDELVAQIVQLRKENHQIITNLNITRQYYLNFETENSVLKAQVSELSNRLQSLNEIVGFLNGVNEVALDHHSFINPLDLVYLNQPIMASADMFEY